MFKCECVYRRYLKLSYSGRKRQLVISKEYKKLLKHIGKAIKAGKQVIMEHKIIDNKLIDGDSWYDKVIVTIK